jgi:CspA family cold shock protein
MESSPQAGSDSSGVTAKVKWFNPAKGFGFVAPTNGTPDAFLHVSVVHKAGLRTLRQGATIICDLAEGEKGSQVTAIETVDNSTVVDDVPEGNETILDGEIKFFAADKGYGFGVPEGGGHDIFIGIGALQRSNLDRLESGQRVRMHVQDGDKGPMATQVEIIGDAPAEPPSEDPY